MDANTGCMAQKLRTGENMEVNLSNTHPPPFVTGYDRLHAGVFGQTARLRTLVRIAAHAA